MSKFLAATLGLAGAELYCPDENSWVNEGVTSYENGGWTVQGEGGTTGKTSFNLLGGYVEFDVDNSGSQWGVNNNFYTISPDHPYTERNDYCDGQGPEASSPLGIYCMELDIYEANGGQNLATTWHTWFNHDGGCDQGGCGADADIGGQFHVKAEFDSDGWMHVYINGAEMGSDVGGYNPFPSDNAKKSVMDTMNSRGVVFSSSQWTGWVPGPGNVDGDVGNSRFSISNVRVSGSVVMGPEPPKCGGGPSPPPSPPTPSMCENSVGKNNDGTNLQSNAINTNSAEDCCSHCSSTSGCAGYTWVHSSNECWLKSSVGPSRDDGYVTSGTYSSPTPPPSPSTTPSPSPSPSGCPAGNLASCIQGCPTYATLFPLCVGECSRRCSPSCTGGDDGADLLTCIRGCPADGFSDCIQCCSGKFTSVTLV